MSALLSEGRLERASGARGTLLEQEREAVPDEPLRTFLPRALGLHAF
jgi:hypothetical protein